MLSALCQQGTRLAMVVTIRLESNNNHRDRVVAPLAMESDANSGFNLLLG